ncbi:hypothetical protein RhiirA4_463346 [Rhizophagus irregularis]|uniref:Uncharacterized protein n=1 Tax=Rhizophagus irregularis TaxID=588596 RepID=A0A2I1GMS1_9GLOM|nr:hypothetical protein RhiirA4_463346 [Rhizophagus irregularis]
MLSFNLIIKSATDLTLPSKWLEIEVSSLDDILAEVHYYVGKLEDYAFRLFGIIKINRSWVQQLTDMQDYKKFLVDYKKLLDKKKNILIVLEHLYFRILQFTDSDEETENENIKLYKKKNARNNTNAINIIQGSTDTQPPDFPIFS